METKRPTAYVDPESAIWVAATRRRESPGQNAWYHRKRETWRRAMEGAGYERRAAQAVLKLKGW